MREPRRTSLAPIDMQLHGYHRVTVLLRNISPSGLSARVVEVPAEGEQVQFVINGIGEISGEVRWVRDNHIGVKLNEVIDPTAMIIERSTPATEATDKRPVYAHLFVPTENAYKRPRMAKP